MKEAFKFQVFTKRGEVLMVNKTISRRSVYRVMVNLMRKHEASEVGLV